MSACLTAAVEGDPGGVRAPEGVEEGLVQGVLRVCAARAAAERRAEVPEERRRVAVVELIERAEISRPYAFVELLVRVHA